jgi:predicted nuclease of predicted toxin-antitoxin system
MKIKLDENLPHGLAMELEKLGHDARTAVQENLQGSTDKVIWEAVQNEGRFFITQDMDFSDLRRFAPGAHFGILLRHRD